MRISPLDPVAVLAEAGPIPRSRTRDWPYFIKHLWRHLNERPRGATFDRLCCKNCRAMGSIDFAREVLDALIACGLVEGLPGDRFRVTKARGHV